MGKEEAKRNCSALGAIHSRKVSLVSVRHRWVLLAALTAIVFGLAWLVISGRVAYLTLSRRYVIEVNGTAVQGEILENRFSAIVTRRDAGKRHSYFLSFEGDVDSTGIGDRLPQVGGPSHTVLA